MSFLTALESFFNSIFSKIKPGLVYLEQHVPALLVTIAEDAVLAGLNTGWGSVLSLIEKEAESKGLQVTKEAIAIAANAAQSNLIATGAIATPNAVPAA